MEKEAGGESVDFLCDEMLFRLARWLRIAGYDVSAPRGINDRKMARIAEREGRVLLTRDKDLSNMKGSKKLRIVSDDLEEQLSEVFKAFQPDINVPGHSRCPMCNGDLRTFDFERLSRSEKQEIPPKVADANETYYVCNDCGKVYWEGTHWKRIRALLGEHDIEPILP